MALNITQHTPDTFTYVPKDQREEEAPFSVTFKKLPLTVLASIMDSALTIKDSGTYEINVNKQVLDALRHGLTGWENISDGKTPIKFRLVHNLADMVCLEYLPVSVRAEIGNVILDVSKDPSNAEDYLTAA